MEIITCGQELKLVFIMEKKKRLGRYMMAITRVKYVKVLFFFFPSERNMIRGWASKEHQTRALLAVVKRKLGWGLGPGKEDRKLVQKVLVNMISLN